MLISPSCHPPLTGVQAGDDNGKVHAIGDARLEEQLRQLRAICCVEDVG
jgi:hypothetical protein